MKTDDGCYLATSDNLPAVFHEMVYEFYFRESSFFAAEIRGANNVRTWRIMFALFVLLDTALSIAQVMIYWFGVSYVDDKGVYVYVGTHYYFALYAQYVHMVLHGLSILECVMSLSGLGFNQYFSRNVNKIEFACGIILGTVMIGIIINDSLEFGKLIHPFNRDVIMLINVFMWLRIVKLHILVKAIVPRVILKDDKLLTDENEELISLQTLSVLSEQNCDVFEDFEEEGG